MNLPIEIVNHILCVASYDTKYIPQFVGNTLTWKLNLNHPKFNIVKWLYHPQERYTTVYETVMIDLPFHNPITFHNVMSHVLKYDGEQITEYIPLTQEFGGLMFTYDSYDKSHNGVTRIYGVVYGNEMTTQMYQLIVHNKNILFKSTPQQFWVLNQTTGIHEYVILDTNGNIVDDDEDEDVDLNTTWDLPDPDAVWMMENEPILNLYM
jgi:hypothetical protein